MDQTLQFVIPALMGVEATVAYELKKLGLGDVRAENGRVLCRGGLADIPRINLNLRCGARVLLCLGSFPARSFEELFQGV
ncbi:MAG: class I SAM-dependent RNA methyltransferase, partial [Oscillospiraceae bacterium]